VASSVSRGGPRARGSREDARERVARAVALVCGARLGRRLFGARVAPPRGARALRARPSQGHVVVHAAAKIRALDGPQGPAWARRARVNSPSPPPTNDPHRHPPPRSPPPRIACRPPVERPRQEGGRRPCRAGESPRRGRRRRRPRSLQQRAVSSSALSSPHATHQIFGALLRATRAAERHRPARRCVKGHCPPQARARGALRRGLMETAGRDTQGPLTAPPFSFCPFSLSTRRSLAPSSTSSSTASRMCPRS
jgi:hypothetical protein